MKYIVKILETGNVTHDVKYFRFEKPGGYTFVPGQATDVAINKPGWEEEKRPFTFTCLATRPYLEFTIKRYTDHHGVTEQLHLLQPGDELIIEDAWGAIEYSGAGYFIAGGAGITPFIAILRDLYGSGSIEGNTLFFSNKTSDDIIYREELTKMLGENAVYILTKENGTKYKSGYLDENFIRQHVKDISKHFYVCGPDKMVSDITGILKKMGADTDAVVFEK